MTSNEFIEEKDLQDISFEKHRLSYTMKIMNDRPLHIDV